MIKDCLFTRFPKPDIGIALHDTNNLPFGKVGITPGYAKANADSVRITVYGKGGHGAQPQTTVDPVLIAARIAVTVQSIVSREIKPGDAAVITIGYIQAGTKNNIIPDDAQMGFTVRSFKPDVRQHLLAGIERVAKAEAMAAGAEKMPLVEKYESTSAVYHDPVLTQHMASTMASVLGRRGTWKEYDHDVRRLCVLCGAGHTVVLLYAGGCRSTETGGSESRGKAVAQQSLAVVRARARAVSQDRHHGGSDASA
jgi:hippurate hydrolase